MAVQQRVTAKQLLPRVDAGEVGGLVRTAGQGHLRWQRTDVEFDLGVGIALVGFLGQGREGQIARGGSAGSNAPANRSPPEAISSSSA